MPLQDVFKVFLFSKKTNSECLKLFNGVYGA